MVDELKMHLVGGAWKRFAAHTVVAERADALTAALIERVTALVKEPPSHSGVHHVDGRECVTVYTQVSVTHGLREGRRECADVKAATEEALLRHARALSAVDVVALELRPGPHFVQCDITFAAPEAPARTLRAEPGGGPVQALLSTSAADFSAARKARSGLASGHNVVALNAQRVARGRAEGPHAAWETLAANTRANAAARAIFDEVAGAYAAFVAAPPPHHGVTEEGGRKVVKQPVMLRVADERSPSFMLLSNKALDKAGSEATCRALAALLRAHGTRTCDFIAGVEVTQAQLGTIWVTTTFAEPVG